MRLKELSIKKKFVLVLIVFILIPTCVVSMWVYRTASTTWIKQEYSNQSNELGNILKTTELQLKRYENIIYKIYEDTSIVEVIKTEEEKRIPIDYVHMTDYLRGIQSEDEYVKSVYLFANEGEVFFQDSTANGNFASGNFENLYINNMKWQKQIQERNGAATWLSTYEVRSVKKQKKYFSCAFVVKDLASTWEPFGVLILNIDLKLFDDLFELLGQQDDHTTYMIVDNDGNIIWSNHLEAARILDEKFFESVQLSNGTCSEQEYEKEQYVVTKFYSDYNNWNYISMKSREEVLKSGVWVVQMTVVLLLCIVLFSIFGAIMIQRYIIHPIQKMVAAMSVPEKELLGRRLYIDQDDEIGKLYRSFNEMNQKIESYIAKNNEINKREKEYQIQALNAQINPHFIYNTLDTLHWMALDIPAPDICRMITSFSEILRYSISKKESIVTLKDELICIRNYIDIYEERYELHFGQFVIDERVYPYKTFRMLLQPIIENCIVHGFAQDMEHAMIEVRAELENEEAVLKIIDNGVGISRERVAYVLSQNSDRVGLSNINQRLKLLYGEEYGLEIVSQKGKGTTVILRFPKDSLNM